MHFLNSYQYPQAAEHYRVLQVGNAIFLFGKYQNSLLITKLNVDGTLQWSKIYSNISFSTTMVRNAVECDNGEIIVMIQNYGQIPTPSCTVLRFRPLDGLQIWCKNFAVNATTVREAELNKVGRETYMLYMHPTDNSTGSQYYVYLVTLNGSGDIIKKAKYQAQSALTSYNLGIAGDNYITSDGTYIYVATYLGILKLNYNLELVSKFTFSENVNLSSLSLKDSKIVLTGWTLINATGSGFVSIFDFPTSNQNVQFSGFNNSVQQVKVWDDCVYVSYPNNAKFEKYNFITGTIVWSKKIALSTGSLLTEIVNNDTIFIINSLTVGLLNPDADSCKTTINSTPGQITAKNIGIVTNYGLNYAADFVVNVSTITTTPVTVQSTFTKLCVFGDEIPLSSNTMLQSSHFYMQAAGSEGNDSAKGIHLRWAFREELAEHLPKGNYATTNFNFNKSDDFVKVYRAKYNPEKVILDFNNAPIQLNEANAQKNWLYSVNDKIFHVYFRDTVKYNQVRATINPSNAPLDFIAAYGDSLLEIETKTDLSFKISPVFKIIGSDNNVRVELLSVTENKITAPKAASLRKKYSLTAINQNGLVAENIRSIRFRSVNGYVQTVAFEFYADFITGINQKGNWEVLGEYALTKDDAVAFERLEPEADSLKTWLRYNEQAFVNPLNYKTRWNGNTLPPLERIVTSVERYIALSDSYDNPKAIEYFPFEDQSAAAACALTNPDYDPYMPEGLNEANSIPISYLDVLLLGSTDYHNARMLGLGTLDLDEEVFSGAYIYLAEYLTFGDLQDGLGAREVQHLYCSLPTSLSDHRLPIPVDLQQPVAGLFFDNGYDDSEVDEEEVEDPEQLDYSSVELTDDGYTPDGKTRYYTFYAQSIFDEDYNAPFYYVDTEFVAAESTYPVFAGLEYRNTGDTKWIKPELSYNPEFYNIDSSGIDPNKMNETVEIVIPDAGKPLYSHAVKESGKLDYSSYGINWFSRANQSRLVYTVETLLKPANELLPPTSVMATLIQKERPLLLSTSAEQDLYEANPDTDKTIVRLTFEYNHAQELIDYHYKINDDVINNYFETPDYKEPFADKIEVFFRDRVPASVYGKVKAVTQLSNPLVAEITTEPYIVLSQGINENIIPQTNPPTYNQVYTPSIIPGSENNYIGSIFLVNGIEYVIQEIDNSGAYPTFIVLKADASEAMLNLNSGSVSNAALIVPEPGGLFMVIENMQNLSSWNIPVNPGFTVNIDLTEVYREDEIIIENTDCTTETHVQKFRGVYKKATITKLLEKVDLNDNGYFDVNSGVEGDPNNSNFVYKHRGAYKVTFLEFHLPQHSQYTIANNSYTNSVEWHNGILRLHTLSGLGATPRKEFNVIRTENIGTSNNLVLYIQDLTFPSDETLLGSYEGKVIPDGDESATQMVNYYPGYKLYLYKDNDLGLNENTVLPEGEQDIRYTIFGLRSKDLKNEFEYDNAEDFFSKMSIPALMFANALMEPARPQKPMGGMYATRPDYYGKASYTFTTKYGSESDRHKPYSVQFNRASDIQFLSAIYDTAVHDNDQQNNPVLNTLQIVLKNIFMEGEEDFYVNRWNNLLSFNYTYTDNPADNGRFMEYEGRRLPLPDNSNFIGSINTFIDEHNRFYNLTGSNAVPHLASNFNLNTLVIPGMESVNGALFVKDFLRDVLLNCFTPLTEIPIVYNYVNGSSYIPIPKKQVVRDRNGNLLNPSDTNFDMAPMMKRIDPPGEQYASQFTDFGLDGASNAKYFYAVREMNNQLKTSDYSEILGPISLVNTAPPVAPQIIKVIPILESRVSDIAPAIQLQINSYPKSQHIAKASIYRATDPTDALSVRTMKLIKVVDLEEEGILESSQWILEDDFIDIPEIPFGDPLFYRMTVSRRIRYNDSELNTVVDYTPSEASKLIITNIVENYSPVSPILDYYSEPLNADNELGSVILHWEKTCYKGKYHVYKMNSQGNWVKIHELQTNDQDIYLPLADTLLHSGILTVTDEGGDTIYHHFKVIAENTAGMLSSEEKILTIYIQDNWQDIGGIGEMITGNTFIIR